jgi:hypothetical protein
VARVELRALRAELVDVREAQADLVQPPEVLRVVVGDRARAQQVGLGRQEIDDGDEVLASSLLHAKGLRASADASDVGRWESQAGAVRDVGLDGPGHLWQLE